MWDINCSEGYQRVRLWGKCLAGVGAEEQELVVCDLGLQGGLQTTVTLAGELGNVLFDKLNFTPESKKLLGCSSFGVFPGKSMLRWTALPFLSSSPLLLDNRGP